MMQVDDLLLHAPWPVIDLLLPFMLALSPPKPVHAQQISICRMYDMLLCIVSKQFAQFQKIRSFRNWRRNSALLSSQLLTLRRRKGVEYAARCAVECTDDWIREGEGDDTYGDLETDDDKGAEESEIFLSIPQWSARGPNQVEIEDIHHGYSHIETSEERNRRHVEYRQTAWIIGKRKMARLRINQVNLARDQGILGQTSIGSAAIVHNNARFLGSRIAQLPIYISRIIQVESAVWKVQALLRSWHVTNCITQKFVEL